MHSTAAIAFGAFLAWIGSGCATSSATTHAPSSQEAASAVDPDARGLHFVRLLGAGELRAAHALMNRKMRAGLPQGELAAAWRHFTEPLGASAEVRIDTREEKPEYALRVFAMDGPKAGVRVQLAIDRSTGEIGGLYFLPPKPAAAPSAAARPTHVGRSVDLHVGSPVGALGATLTLPDGEGPHPAVVLVAGSGPADRDASLGPNKPFRDLAEQLSGRGVAALRYDKRTHAHPEALDPRTLTVEDEVIADAVAAAHLLGKRAEVRQACIVVVGHSLGALLAPEIAARAPALAGTVLLAAPGRPLAQVAVAQARFLGSMPEPALRKLEQQASLLQAGKLPADETVLGVPAHYWIDLDRRDEIALARRTGKPLLYLRGARDYQVLAEDLEAWQRGLAGVPRAAFETLPDLNHLFIRGEGPPGPAEYGRHGTVAPVVAERIARFVAEICPGGRR